MGSRSSTVEGLDMNPAFWRGKRVFLTGHTGFKGGWLALWLTELGAEVYGYALAPPTEPNFFTLCKLKDRLAHSTLADIRDAGAITRALNTAQAEIVLHLAAQPLVHHSYTAPVDTYAVNVMGTVNLMEAVRHVPSVKAVVNVTTDKCYENREWVWPYRESEAMGGFDPYSSSKGCSELITAAYRRSFLAPAGIHVASARAGNVIGGGDWAVDRLIPDCLRAMDNKQPLLLRSPSAIRPWQHVCEPLSGYLLLAEQLCTCGEEYADAWNFGPDSSDARSVQWIVENIYRGVPDAHWQTNPSAQPHEAHALTLDSAKARTLLGWRPRWPLSKALDMTMAWHKAWRQGQDMAALSLQQIQQYIAVSQHE
jgi:CDP-glucose 4,6-dehydratase